MHADVERYYWGGKNHAGKKLTPVRHTVGASHGANGKTRGASYANLRDGNITKTHQMETKLGHPIYWIVRPFCGLSKKTGRIRLLPHSGLHESEQARGRQAPEPVYSRPVPDGVPPRQSRRLKMTSSFRLKSGISRRWRCRSTAKSAGP